MGRLVAASVTEQVQQGDPVPLLGEGLGDAAVELCVQQQAVQIDDQRGGGRAVEVVDEPVPVVAEGEVELDRDDAHQPPPVPASCEWTAFRSWVAS